MVDAAANGLNAYPVTSGSDQLTKGAVKYIPGPIVAGLNTTEGPADALPLPARGLSLARKC